MLTTDSRIGAKKHVRAMTVSDRDIWISAGLTIKQYGNDAASYAAQRADSLLSQGDVDGQQVWLRIMRACTAMQQANGTLN